MALLPCLLIGLTVLGFTMGPDENATPSASYLRKELGILRDEYTILHEEDSHGGFHGDGLYFVVLDCSGKMEEVQKLTADWREVPLPKDLHRVLYDRYVSEFDPASSGQFPVAENGCYYFNNRHHKAESFQDEGIFAQSSLNFSLAVFNRDNNTLCLMCFDT